MKSRLRRVYWVIKSQFGIDPIRFLKAIARLPRYVADWKNFSGSEKDNISIRPCLHDLDQEGGSIRNEYFWQDLLVARMICDRAPSRHVDIGSRIDGFVAHVASFREIEVFDVRPITPTIPGVTFRRANMAESPPETFREYADSVSCLHALEHFGLGRYGDPIDSQAFERGFSSISAILEPGGMLYLSVPVGQPRVEFNAHRVSSPTRVVELGESNGLVPSEIYLVTSAGEVRNLANTNSELEKQEEEPYNLAIFLFIKQSKP